MQRHRDHIREDLQQDLIALLSEADIWCDVAERCCPVDHLGPHSAIQPMLAERFFELKAFRAA